MQWDLTADGIDSPYIHLDMHIQIEGHVGCPLHFHHRVDIPRPKFRTAIAVLKVVSDSMAVSRGM